MLHGTFINRTCVDMPGIQLPGGDAKSFPQLTSSSNAVRSHPDCRKRCQEHDGCKQVVFSRKDGCLLSGEAATKVLNFKSDYTSSFCGQAGEEKVLMKMLHAAYKQKTTRAVVA